jgi:hypothetical protein
MNLPRLHKASVTPGRDSVYSTQFNPSKPNHLQIAAAIAGNKSVRKTDSVYGSKLGS